MPTGIRSIPAVDWIRKAIETAETVRKTKEHGSPPACTGGEPIVFALLFAVYLCDPRLKMHYREGNDACLTLLEAMTFATRLLAQNMLRIPIGEARCLVFGTVGSV
jgi:hypothetical protein